MKMTKRIAKTVYVITVESTKFANAEFELTEHNSPSGKHYRIKLLNNGKIWKEVSHPDSFNMPITAIAHMKGLLSVALKDCNREEMLETYNFD